MTAAKLDCNSHFGESIVQREDLIEGCLKQGQQVGKESKAMNVAQPLLDEYVARAQKCDELQGLDEKSVNIFDILTI